MKQVTIHSFDSHLNIINNIIMPPKKKLKSKFGKPTGNEHLAPSEDDSSDEDYEDRNERKDENYKRAMQYNGQNALYDDNGFAVFNDKVDSPSQHTRQ